MKIVGRLIENFTLQDKLIATKQQIRDPTQENFIEQEEVASPNFFVVDSCFHELESDDFIYCFVYNPETGFIDQHKK
jgi:hypothetical protein